MTDEIWRRDEPESPCIKVCVLEPASGRCIGCHRTGEEIARWPGMSPEERHALLRELARRAAERPARRGGRAGRLARHQDR